MASLINWKPNIPEKAWRYAITVTVRTCSCVCDLYFLEKIQTKPLNRRREGGRELSAEGNGAEFAVFLGQFCLHLSGRRGLLRGRYELPRVTGKHVIFTQTNFQQIFIVPVSLLLGFN